EDALVRLPATELALDDDAVEEAIEAEPVDAASLRRSAAVRDQRHAHTARAQRIERFDRASVRRKRSEPSCAVVRLDRLGGAGMVSAKIRQRVPDNCHGRSIEVEAS